MKTRSLKSNLATFVIIGVLFALTSCDASDSTDKYLQYPMPPKGFSELTYTPSKTTFRVWAPTADEARVLLYSDGETGHADKMFSLTQDITTGVWSINIDRDLEGVYYAFNVKINDAWQGDTPGIMAKAVGKNGKRAVILNWENTNPNDWHSDTSPNTVSSDVLIYELHVGSFTGSKSSMLPHEIAGKYLGALQSDIKLSDSITTVGIDHLKELGVSHIKLMPVFDFINNEDQQLADSDFLWGYDPLNYNVPEGAYSTNPSDPISRIKEFKSLVQGLHRLGFNVLMDVSYAYANATNSNFQKTFPGYFYQQDKLDEILIGDNQKGVIATHRPAVKQFILSSLQYWMQEYHIDGFCFDQLNLYDTNTLFDIETSLKSINRSVLLLGNSSNEIIRLPQEKKAGLSELMQTFSIALRSEHTDSVGRSYMLGDGSFIAPLKSGLLGGVNHPQLNRDSLSLPWTYFIDNPLQAINYISTNDGESLSAYLKRILGRSYNTTVQYRLNALAYTYLFSSQGIPLLRAGEEFLSHPVYSSDIGKATKGYYINWSNKLKANDIYSYIRGLLQLRKHHPAFRMNSGNAVGKHIEFLPTEKELVVAYRIKNNANGDEWEDIVVIFNAHKEAVRVNVPEGKYIAVCRDGLVNELGLNYVYNQAYVSGQSAMILYRTDKQVYIPQPKPKEVEPTAVDKKIIKKPKIDIFLRPIAPKKTNISDRIRDIKIK